MPIETCADLGAFFRAELSEALRQRRARLEPETSDYLVELLAQCATTSGGALLEGSLVLRLDEALAQAPTGRLGALVGVGDAALCRSGLFRAREEEAVGGLGLCVTLGGYAYREAVALARSTHGSAPVALHELGERFPQVIDVVAEVAESSALGVVTRDLVKLYDRWRAAGSSRALEALALQGLFPGRAGGEG